ncbi:MULTISPECIES: GTPase HflX [unclassified Sporolactobacillus]|uniref:GTPase HflX n=1 Tax=unclassified Sporolactobacillus TaxID=2628533 RepID=UPI002368C7D0|nr:GTPase HflX [Sporolactobacillus sp. CQH2019]MDD9149671.1 GTPase HflX [Sporolactobacillus sp. CQH2019]
MENVILVGCQLPHQSDDRFDSSLQELEALVKTAGGEVVAVSTQKRQQIDSATYIGKGKLEEVEALEKQLGADAVIFNGELSPGQQSRLNTSLFSKVLDRTQLILDIFAMRARSREGKLQVELAQLNYLLPRLSGMGDSLSRLGGGIGTRGPGETKLETDRRYIRNRMKDIGNQLKTVAGHRKRYRDRRTANDQCLVVLVGYTNAGKSTLFNRLTSAHTYVENQLFATLDPLTRKMKLPNGLICLLSDTVGFIQDLPTQLVAAFRSTLEEITGARLIIHVVDASDPDLIAQERTVAALMSELGADDLPVLKLYNKRDLLQTAFIAPKEALLISARSIEDGDRVLQAVQNELIKQMVPFKCRIPADEGRLLNEIMTHAVLERRTFIEEAQSYEVEGFVFPETPLASKLIKHAVLKDGE